MNGMLRFFFQENLSIDVLLAPSQATHPGGMVVLGHKISAAVILILLTGCTVRDSTPGSVLVRDSAGIRIIEHTQETPEHTSWELDPEPVLRIGNLLGSEEESLFRVRGARRLSDSRVAVINAGTYEVRYYSAAGFFEGAFGRRGEGPGEFSRLSSFMQVLPGDTVVVYDPGLRRVTMIHTGGRASVSVNLETQLEVTGTEYVGRLLDGTHIAAHTLSPRSGSQLNAYRDTVAVLRHGQDGRSMNEIGRFPGGEMAAIRRSQGSVQMMPAPFGTRLFILLEADTIIALHSSRDEVRRFDPTGRLIKVERRQSEPRPVTDQERAEYPPSMFPGLTLPDVLPYFENVQMASDGRIWLADFNPSGADDLIRWNVYGRDGDWLGGVDLPAGWTVLSTGEEELMIMEKDSLGIEYVEARRLRPSVH